MMRVSQNSFRSEPARVGGNVEGYFLTFRMQKSQSQGVKTNSQRTDWSQRQHSYFMDLTSSPA
jgi:hypothetical protein